METAEQQGAYIYATCHGIMNLFINGEEITNHQFMPGTQQYDKRLMIETLEVTRFLREGENEIMVSLGDGWYRGAMGFSRIKIFMERIWHYCFNLRLQESQLLFRTKHGLQPRMVRLEKMSLWQGKYMMPGKNSRWNMV